MMQMFDDLTMPPCSKLLGWRLIEARPEEGFIKIGFEGKPEFCNPAGCIQGGLLTAMLDDTMGPAVFLLSGGKLFTPTVSLNVNFLAPARVGPLVGEAKVVQMGKTIVFVESRLTDEAGTLIATATSASRLIESAKAVK